MNKVMLAALGSAALLAACAPALTAPVTGRIVNAGTGQEGTVTFLGGALQPGMGRPTTDNVTLQIGGQSYTGQVTLLDAAVGAAPYPVFDLSLGVGGVHSGPASDLFWGTRFRSPATVQSVLRTGNLIARTAGAAPRTLTCTLQVDASGRGIGDCTGSDGARYVLQF